MKRFLIEILNEGFTPEQANAVRGGAADNDCTCYGAGFTCNCYNSTGYQCKCNGTTFSCTCHARGVEYKCDGFVLPPITE